MCRTPCIYMFSLYLVKNPDSRHRATIILISPDETGLQEAKAGESLTASLVETGAAGLLPVFSSPYCI
jgi:hypothetical protein